MPEFVESSSTTALHLQQPQHRVRRRPVSFGNPALGTFQGNVYTVEFSNSRQQSRLFFPFPVVEQALSVDRTVAMVDVPPEQVPDGIFNLLRAHRPWIKHLRIVIAGPLEDDTEESNEGSDQSGGGDQSSKLPASSTLARSNSQAAQSASVVAAAAAGSAPMAVVQNTFQGLASERNYLILLEIESDDAAEQLVEDLNGQPYTSLDETCCCSIYHVVALQGHDGLQSPILAASLPGGDVNSNTGTAGQGATIHQSQTTIMAEIAAREAAAKVVAALVQPDGEYNCAVCLEHLHHTNDGSNGQELSSVLTTVCNHSFHMDCLLKWQDSSCPVCRYDHSGLNETLSQCHICGTTGNNYVCLICGMISCGRPSAGGPSPFSSSSAPYESECAASSGGHVRVRPPIDGLSLSHARQHYDETLHAYALDTETQHVWDFAGHGYVHRLLQNKDDGKLVEVSDPTALSGERTQNPGLSETQEEQAVHQKLEGMANSYYTLLKSQLEQQRIYYEGRLDEIRHDNRPQRASDLIAALKHERHQLTQRLVILQSRRNKVKEDATFLTSMVDSLRKNKASLREEVAAARKERAAIRLMFETRLPPLQEKVTRLMLQLEAECNAATPMTSPVADLTDDMKPQASRRPKK